VWIIAERYMKNRVSPLTIMGAHVEEIKSYHQWKILEALRDWSLL
jgi:hypothetical protein